MPISPETIRSRVEDAALSVEGWRRSNLAWGLFGKSPQQPGHKTLAVGVPSTETREPRHSASVGALSDTTIALLYSYAVRPASSAEDYDLALVEEGKIIAAVYSVGNRSGLHTLYLLSSRRAIESDGKYLLGDLRFRATHHLPLA